MFKIILLCALVAIINSKYVCNKQPIQGTQMEEVISLPISGVEKASWCDVNVTDFNHFRYTFTEDAKNFKFVTIKNVDFVNHTLCNITALRNQIQFSLKAYDSDPDVNAPFSSFAYDGSEGSVDFDFQLPESNITELHIDVEYNNTLGCELRVEVLFIFFTFDFGGLNCSAMEQLKDLPFDLPNMGYVKKNINVLRSFRDSFLSTFNAGRSFTNLYYKNGNNMIEFFKNHQIISAISLLLLYPLIFVLKFFY